MVQPADADGPVRSHVVLASADSEAFASLRRHATSRLDFPVTPGEELSDLAPVRTGAGFRYELSYTVTDLRTLQ
jgi:hypothetical protein